MKTILLTGAFCFVAALSFGLPCPDFELMPLYGVADTPHGEDAIVSPGWLIFDEGSAAITAVMHTSLSLLGSQMRSLPGARVVIVTQGGGGPKAKLNSERAQALVQFMGAKYGIPSSRFSFVFTDDVEDANALNYQQVR
jgi:hypothetical protein